MPGFDVYIGGIKVNTGVLRDTASRMRMFNGNLYDVLAAAKRKVNDMQNVTWISPAGEAIIAKMNALEPTFQRQRDTLSEYCRFLDNTAGQYETNEDALVGNAGRVPGRP